VTTLPASIDVELTKMALPLLQILLCILLSWSMMRLSVTSASCTSPCSRSREWDLHVSLSLYRSPHILCSNLNYFTTPDVATLQPLPRQCFARCTCSLASTWLTTLFLPQHKGTCSLGCSLHVRTSTTAYRSRATWTHQRPYLLSA
jgi:hypothetical protein